MVKIYPEDELVRGCKNGDTRYQQALYRQYQAKMYGVCLRYAKCREDAKDLLQDGFVKVFTNIQNFRGEGSLEGWVRRIIVHTCIGQYRRKREILTINIDAAHHVQVDTRALARLSQHEILMLIQSLPNGYRTVFNLYAVEGYSHQEIGEMLGITVGTSKSQLARAKKMLQRRLNKLYEVNPQTPEDIPDQSINWCLEKI